jgi:hypothetical protein
MAFTDSASFSRIEYRSQPICRVIESKIMFVNWLKIEKIKIGTIVRKRHFNKKNPLDAKCKGDLKIRQGVELINPGDFGT